jgi:uncharacterized protein YkwD
MKLIDREGLSHARPFTATSTLFLTALLLVASLNQTSPVVTRELVIRPALAGDFSFKQKELCVMERINKIRARHGLNKLRKDPQLGYVARQHSRTMAATGTVFHDDTVGAKVTNWIRLGQNTGRGPTCRYMVRSFKHDPVHKEIILGAWRWQGVGVKKGGKRYYFQHLFTSGGDPGNIFNIP